MAVETKTGIPSIIECGDTVIFTETFTDYPASAWTVALVLSLNGATITPIAGTGSGTTWTFTMSTAFTDARTPGEHIYAFYATETATSQRERAKTGIINLIPNLAETRSATANETALANLESALATLQASPDASVSFNGQTVTFRDISQLSKEYVRIKAAVIAERKKADSLRGIRNSNTIAPLFVQ